MYTCHAVRQICSKNNSVFAILKQQVITMHILLPRQELLEPRAARFVTQIWLQVLG